jgi:cytochrome c-type biogenesis protein CcmH/NrfG
VAEPARRTPATDEPPVLDPRAVERAYRRQRVRRRVLVERNRERGRARLRFWLVLVILISLSVYLALTVWQQVEELFGL